MASSSSSSASPKLYDAFISHRGPDVKETLAKHLYDLLRERGFRAFLDRPEIRVGDSITLAINNGICSSLVQIAIFSPGYAESSWCLDELVLMLKQTGALFIPVFYDVEPWELRHIKNPKSGYAKAFSDYRSNGRYPDRKLFYLSVYKVEDIWSTFHQQLETNTQASFELRKLRIISCPCLEKLPDLIGMFSHLEELELWHPLWQTDIKQLSTIRSLNLSKGRDSTSLEASASSRTTSLETIHFVGSGNIEKLLVSGEFCPRLQSLTVEECGLETISISGLSWLQSVRVEMCRKLETISGLPSLTGLKVFEVTDCRGLKSLPSLAHQRHLEQFAIRGCDKLQSVEGFEEWQGLKSLAIEVPDNGHAWVRNCIYGLKMLPSEKTILAGKLVETPSSRLDVNILSEVSGIEAVVEMQRGEHGILELTRSSSNAITIYAFLATSSTFGSTDPLLFIETMCK